MTIFRFLFAIVICVTTLPALSQTPSSKYQVGTIVAVKQHEDAHPDASSTATRYDVSVKVRDTIYVVLYTSPNSINAVQYAPGSDVLVLIGKDSLTISRKLDGTTEVPILRTETLPAQPTIDWSKAQSQYFSMKMQNLTEKLSLSEDQQAKIKPIAEQEGGEVGGVCFTPTIPRKERLDRFEKIVRASDAKMRPILSQDQWAKLQELRREQKQELKSLIAK